jgi:2-oxoglutarate dehydrogenase E2 component (dihydrolipoamide succinyltransferase)
MSVQIRVPQLPESVADATLVAWRKEPGQAVTRDENLADLETDKVVLEVPAPANGVLREIAVPSGTTVKSGDLLAVIDEGAVAEPAAAAPAAGNGKAPPAASAPAAARSSAEPSKAGPAARRVIEENQLAAGAIAGSAPGGRITKTDAMAAAAAASAKPAPAPSTPPTESTGPRAGRIDQRVPMTRLRARIAERMVQAQSTQALLTTFNEVDLTGVQELRARYKDAFEKKHGAKLGFMSFFVKASVEAL